MAEKYFKLSSCKEFYWFADSRLYPAPTGDCQTFSISYFGTLVRRTDIKDILKELYDLTSKKQLLVNVRKEEDYNYMDIIDNLCKDKEGSIVIKQEYTSTRNSEMVMYLINIYKLLELNEINAF